MTDPFAVRLGPMPYVRNPELCELCGQRQWPETFPLQQITLKPASGGTPSQPNYRAARVMFVCSRHEAFDLDSGTS